MNFIDELSWRGLVHQQTDERLRELVAEPMTLYVGFDPTASSLHAGNLVPLLALIRAQRAGLRPIALVGGATGMVGDPSGKSEERKLLTDEELARNVAGVRGVLERFLDFGPQGAELVNNHDWFTGLSYLGFLRDVGKQFSVNMMLGKESVRARLEDREHGISYTEFSYMLIQAYDFLWLYQNRGCRLQVGGSDQWGNITAGIDLIRRKTQGEAYGVVMPLVTTASGQKFGKTEKGAVWLTQDRTSPYELYQFFVQTDDRDVGRYLRTFTFLDQATLRALDETVAQAPEKREAQRVLARELVAFVHGAEEARKAEAAAGALFSGDLRALDAGGIAQLFKDAPSTEVGRTALEAGVGVVDLLVRSGVCASKSAARRDIGGGGIYVNDVREGDAERVLNTADLLAGRYVLLRKGKKTYHLVKFE